MKAGHRWLLVTCIAMLAAGVGGIATHGGRDRAAAQIHRSTGPPATHRTTPTTVRDTPRSTTVTTVSGPPGPSSSVLAANMVTPTDMGGFYHVDLTTAASILNSAPCLGGFEPSPSQSGRAATGLIGPDYLGVPTIVEEAVSYPGSSADAVYRSLAAVMRDCASFPVELGGTHVSVRLAPFTIPAVGDAVVCFQGDFAYAGRTDKLQVGVVLNGQTVLLLLYIDSVPQSNPLFGDFVSTVSNALGKLA